MTTIDAGREGVKVRGEGESALANKPMTVRDLLQGSKVQAMAAVCSNALSAEKIVKLFALAASRTPKLLECTPISVANAMMQCAELGVAPGTLGLAYLIPYENRKAGTVECQLIIGYRGLVELARRSGQVSTITSDVVREGDVFIHENGVEPVLKHQSIAPLGSKRTHAWAAVKFRDGSFQAAVMRWEEVMAIKSRSRAGNAGPWVSDTDEMAKKTVLRRLCKLLPLTIETARAIEVADKTEFDFEDMARATNEAEKANAGAQALADRLKGGEKETDAPEEPKPEPKIGDANAEPTDAQLYPNGKPPEGTTGHAKKKK